VTDRNVAFDKFNCTPAFVDMRLVDAFVLLLF